MHSLRLMGNANDGLLQVSIIDKCRSMIIDILKGLDPNATGLVGILQSAQMAFSTEPAQAVQMDPNTMATSRYPSPSAFS